MQDHAWSDRESIESIIVSMIYSNKWKKKYIIVCTKKKKKEIDRFLKSCISILTFNLKIFSNDSENFI